MARGKGEGSIYKEASSGLWAATIEGGRGPNGKRKRHKVRAKTKSEVMRKIQRIRSEHESGIPIADQNQTLSAFLAFWIVNVLPGTVRDSTAAGYKYVLQRYVEPTLGSARLVKLTPEDVTMLLRRLEADGLSANTQRQVRSVLRRALTDAEKYGAVSRNVAALAGSPRNKKVDTSDAFSAADATRLLATAEGDRLGLAAVLGLTLGLRRGEILGLRWGDIDTEAQTIQIARTLKYQNGVGIVTEEPKTQAGVRELPILPIHHDAIRWHRLNQNHERLRATSPWPDEEYVHVTKFGGPIDPRNFLRWWQRLCEEAQVPPTRFHATRHTAATLMLDGGASLEQISKILGHSSIAVTGDIYARPSAESIRGAAAKGLALVSTADGFAR